MTSIGPTIINGGNFVDDRGELLFFNDLDLDIWKRFYVVSNHRKGFIRAWHGHQNESKLIIPTRGVTLVCAVPLDDLHEPSKDVSPIKHVLSSNTPKGFLIPKGYANGFKTLTHDSQLLIFSDSTLEESKKDDYRFSWDYWNCWEEDYR